MALVSPSPSVRPPTAAPPTPTASPATASSAPVPAPSAAASAPAATATPPSPRATARPAGASTLPELLAALEVAAERSAGYDRDLFTHWIDADGDGCNTRREVLVEESLRTVTIGASCSLVGGRWRSLYDGVTTTDAGTFDIDHVVALAEAWRSGARDWTPDRRRRFANDLDVPWALIAVTAASNRAKSDLDPAEWLPPAAEARCEYLAMWLAVKVRWRLAVDTAERTALARGIRGCPQAVRVPVAP